MSQAKSEERKTRCSQPLLANSLQKKDTKLVKEFPFFLHDFIEPLQSAKMRQHEKERADVFILLFIVN